MFASSRSSHSPVSIEDQSREEEPENARHDCGIRLDQVERPGRQLQEEHPDETEPNQLHRRLWAARFPDLCVDPTGQQQSTPGQRQSENCSPHP